MNRVALLWAAFTQCNGLLIPPDETLDEGSQLGQMGRKMSKDSNLYAKIAKRGQSTVHVNRTANAQYVRLYWSEDQYPSSHICMYRWEMRDDSDNLVVPLDPSSVTYCGDDGISGWSTDARVWSTPPFSSACVYASAWGSNSASADHQANRNPIYAFHPDWSPSSNFHWATGASSSGSGGTFIQPESWIAYYFGGSSFNIASMSMKFINNDLAGGHIKVQQSEDGIIWHDAGTIECNHACANGIDITFSPVLAVQGPTQAPTQAPTVYIPASAGPTLTAHGDPHLQNINGQRFDLMRPGTHVLLHIPRSAEEPHILLRVVADVQRLGPHCGDMYFQDINVTGAWVKAMRNRSLQFHAGEAGGEEENTWMTFGPVDLKVVSGHTLLGVRYLNIYARHIGRTKFQVGGLLGDDDHEFAATPDEDCVPKVNLNMMLPQDHPPSMPVALSAEATLA